MRIKYGEVLTFFTFEYRKRHVTEAVAICLIRWYSSSSTTNRYGNTAFPNLRVGAKEAILVDQVETMIGIHQEVDTYYVIDRDRKVVPDDRRNPTDDIQ